jgi:hypothetical protein
LTLQVLPCGKKFLGLQQINKSKEAILEHKKMVLQCSLVDPHWFKETVSQDFLLLVYFISLPLVANLPPVSLTPVTNLPPVSTTLEKLVEKFAAGVVDTGGKFATSVVDTGDNFATVAVDTGGAP